MNICYDASKWKPGELLCIRNAGTSTDALPSLPLTITDLEIDDCMYSEFDLRPNKDLYKLVIRRNTPVRIYFPPNISCLVIQGTQVEYMNSLPISIKSLVLDKCTSTSIQQLEQLVNFHFVNNVHELELPALPPNLRELHCSNNYFTSQTLPPLPPKLEILFCARCNLRTLPNLPMSLRFLRCPQNPIHELPPNINDLRNLQRLDMEDCELTYLPPLPRTLDELNVRNNRLTHIPAIPAALEHLVICGNPIQYYPYIYRANIRVYYDYNELKAAFMYSSFTLNGVKVFTPLHMLSESELGLDDENENEDDHGLRMYMSDMFDDDADADAPTQLLRLHIMCEIQNQVLCRAFMKTIKEELMIKTWHPSRIEAWCGVNFTKDDD
jgi:Leucine-rich repeat (LRR) protein